MTSATPKPRAGEHMNVPWQWYWREESVDGVKRADCGIFHEKRPGHAYSVCRAPQYAKREEWEANARRIVACVNACEGISNEMLADRKAFSAPDSWLRALEAERDLLRERERELVKIVARADELSEAFDLREDKGRRALANEMQELGLKARATLAKVT